MYQGVVLPSRFMVSCNSLNSCSTVKGGVGSSIGSSYIQYDTNIKRKKVFTKTENEQLLQLIKERRQAPSDKQKSIRNKMRKLGFYGRDDWGITDCTETDLIQLKAMEK